MKTRPYPLRLIGSNKENFFIIANYIKESNYFVYIENEYDHRTNVNFEWEMKFSSWIPSSHPFLFGLVDQDWSLIDAVFWTNTKT